MRISGRSKLPFLPDAGNSLARTTATNMPRRKKFLSTNLLVDFCSDDRSSSGSGWEEFLEILVPPVTVRTSSFRSPPGSVSNAASLAALNDNDDTVLRRGDDDESGEKGEFFRTKWEERWFDDGAFNAKAPTIVVVVVGVAAHGKPSR